MVPRTDFPSLCADSTRGRRLPGQPLQHGLQLFADEPHQPALDVGVGHVDHEDEGGRVGRLVLLQEADK